AKIDEPEDTESGGDDEEVTESDREDEGEETRQEEDESFDLIPRTPEESEDDGNDEEDQGLRLSDEERIHEEEEAEDLYRDVNINQGRGLQVSQNIEDSHVTLTLVHPDGLQKSSSVSSFVTSMLNPISDAGMESIYTMASSPIVSLQTPTPILTPSTIATITTSSDAPIPPTPIPTTFSEYRQTNPFVDAVSAIPGIVSQFMNQQMTEAIREAVQIQTDRLQYSFQRENDEFLRTIDDNMKKIIKEQVKSQVQAQVTRILPRIEDSVNAQLEAKVLTRSSHSSRSSYVVAADLSEMELKKILIDKMEGNKSIQRSNEQRNLYKAEDERMMIRKDPPLDQTRGLKDEEKVGSMHQLALHLKQLPRVQADLPQGLNLDSCLPMYLKSTCRNSGPQLMFINTIRFKMDNRKNIVDLEAFREMLHISPRVPGQSSNELPFEEEILDFLQFLRHSAQIKTLSDVNVNKLFQPWRSFAVVINKCLTGKSSSFDSFRLSQAQILWGLYHKRNIDYAFLIWEDFVYQVEHKNQKKSNKMYYPRFIKVIIHHFITEKPSIPR
nr:hypothetical protein [Tanacetum cinerariifolium]